jgi:hypothetical protein
VVSTIFVRLKKVRQICLIYLDARLNLTNPNVTHVPIRLDHGFKISFRSFSSGVLDR